MIHVDEQKHVVKVDNRRANLTPKEFSLLLILAKARGRVLSRDYLLHEVWGHESNSGVDTRTVDQHIARLRGKIGDNVIRTVTNYGYSADDVTVVNDVVNDDEAIGIIISIERAFGKKPSALVRLRVGQILPKLKAGDRVRIA